MAWTLHYISSLSQHYLVKCKFALFAFRSDCKLQLHIMRARALFNFKATKTSYKMYICLSVH